MDWDDIQPGFVLVQLYESDGSAAVFFEVGKSWQISAPPTGELSRAALTKVMAALRYRPSGRWASVDWGAERKFQPIA